MAINQLKKIFDDLRRLSAPENAADTSDRLLLERFIAHRDNAAFESLVRRHGPMVMGVCRRILGNVADAEDAFQATFLVLVHKAARISSRALLANWLYGVAYRTSLNVRRLEAKRQLKERQQTKMVEREAAPQNPWHDISPILDEELTRLPKKYRIPIVLCDLESKSHQEAAQRLGWPIGTLSGRLSRARKLLAQRMTRRGVTLTASALAAELSQQATASVAPTVIAATVKAAGGWLTQKSAATAAISAPVIAITQGVLRTMFIDGFQKASVAAAVLGLVLLASGLMINHQQNANHDDPSPPIAQPEKKPPEKKGLRMIADIRGAALVHAVAYQSVGNTLAAVYGDGSVNVWDMKKREVIKTLNRIVDISAQVAFSRDGTLLAEGREAIRVWDLETGRMVATLEGHESNVRGGGVQCLAFSPDGRWLASGGISRKFGPGMGFGGFGGKGFGGKEPQDEIKLWDLSTGQLKTTFEYKNPHSGLGHDAPIRCLAFSPEGEMLAVGGATKQGDKTTGATVGDIRFYNVQNGKEIRALKGHRYPVASVAFSPDGKMLASASADYSIKLWAVNSYKEKATLFQLSPDQEGLADVSIEFSPDGNTLASASTDNGIKTVRLWDVGTGDLKAMLKGHGGSVSSLSFHPSGTRLASGSHDTTVKEWDVMTASPTATLKEPAADFSGSVYDVVFSPDGKTIAFITNTQEAPVDSALPRTGFTIKLLDVRTGKVKATLDGPVSRLSASFGTSFRERVIPLLFSPDGKTVVTAGFEQGTGRISEKIPVILAWQTSTGKLIATFRHPVVNSGGSGAWNFLAYSPDGKKLASAAVEYTIRLWDLEAGKLRKEFPGKVQTLVFSTDGTSLITDRYTWNLKNGAKKPTFLTIPASRAIFSPDGKTAAAIIDSDLRKRSGATVVLWDLNAQKELATLRESDGTEFRCVSSAHVAFTPDGSRLLVAARGKLFDAQTGKLRTTLQGADGKPLNAYPASNSTIVFSPDSRSLIMIGAVAYSRNKGIPIWDTATGKLRKTLPGHTSYVNSAAFSPDGTLMVTGSADHTIKIWDVSALGK